MHLWILTNEYAPYIIGGLGVVATNLTDALKGKEIFSITVLTKSVIPSVRVREPQEHFKVIRFPRDSHYFSIPKQKFNYRAVISWLEKTRQPLPDLIHVHSVEFAHLARYMQQEYKVPVVYTCHSLVTLESKSLLKKVMANRQKKLLQTADRIVVPSRWECSQLEKVYSFCTGKITVIENGVNVLESSQTSTDPHRLLYVGRLVRLKGIEELLQAVAVLAKKQPRIRLDVVGRGPRRYMLYLKVMAHQLGISSKVRWLGYHPPDKVRELYSSYGAVIVPSRQESFGLVALEALASGVPLVSTRSGGLAQFVNDNVAQIITRVDNGAIVDAIETMWKADQLTKQRVQEGFKAAEPYAWSIIAGRYLELFHDVFVERAWTSDAVYMAVDQHV
jgi:glycosyltransferase involved in cell wall biosynthesis